MAALLLTSDLACGAKFTAAGQRVGCQAQTAASPAALLERMAQARPGLVAIDLNLPGLVPGELVASLRAAPAPPTTILAFGPHVHEARLAAAAAAGCDPVLARGQFFARLDELLAPYAETA